MVPCIRSRSWMMALALCAAAPAAARAEPPVEAPLEAQAEDLFRQARDAMENRQYAKALDLLRESHAAAPGRGKLLNMAICEEELGRFASAWRHVREVLDQLPPGDERRPIAERRLAALAPRIPHVRIEVSLGAPPGLRVALDGEPAAQGKDLPVDPGKHTVTATAADGSVRDFVVTAEEGKRTTARVTAGAAAVAGDGVPSAEDASGVLSGRKVAGIAFGAAGLVGIAVSGALGLDALSKKDRSDVTCGEDGCDAAGYVTRRASIASARAATGTFVAGVAAAAGGAILFATTPRSEPKGAGVALRVIVSGTGAALVGTW